MIEQPKRGTRNVNDDFCKYETEQIDRLNEVFADVELTKGEMQTLVWLAGWEESTVQNVVSAIRKAMDMEKENYQETERETEQPDFVAFQKRMCCDEPVWEYRKGNEEKDL